MNHPSDNTASFRSEDWPMRVHHLNTATLCPRGARFVNGQGGMFARGRLVCHVLLIETDEGLVLVDTGLGLNDAKDPDRLGRRWVRQVAPRLDPAETAFEQVKGLGFQPADVRHILLTHLDIDHAGGLPDFPRAKVHVHVREQEAALARQIWARQGRYRAAHFAHQPDWQLWGGGGESWFGFAGVRPLSKRETDVLIIALPGHTVGHCGIAVRCGEKWLLHAGDAFLFRGQIATPPVPPPLGLAYFQRKADTDRATRIANQERLRHLNAARGDEITIFNSHDPVSFAECCGCHGAEARSVAIGT
jgi:glyoxylase-like metal-dependent hydrolase (beta-lactamase superfamily II)